MKSHFKPGRRLGGFSRQEKSGIFFLLLIIVSLQIIRYVSGNTSDGDIDGNLKVDAETQAKIDALKEQVVSQDSVGMFPFNPNYITDYKGYALGMSLEEIDRLHAYRAENKFVNTKEEFQKITQVSDSLLLAISPYFKFPEWIKTTGNSMVDGKTYQGDTGSTFLDKPGAVRDLNKATAGDLKGINGIGDKLSIRIVKFRDRLGGFLIDDQLYDVYGLKPEVVQRTLLKFKVLQRPVIQKININTASVDEIAELVYIQKHVAEAIVNYRNDNGTIGSFDELTIIEGFPEGRIKRIALYLQL